MEQLERLRLKHGLKQVSQPARWASSAILISIAAVLLLLVVSEERFRQMASNIREIFWMIDAQTKKALFVNEAYETITGRSCSSLLDNPTSYEELIHPDDRTHVLAKLDKATRTGQFTERLRIVCTHGEVRWVHVRGFPVRNPAGKIFRLVGTAQEITEQKHAEDQVIENLAIASLARGTNSIHLRAGSRPRGAVPTSSPWAKDRFLSPRKYRQNTILDIL